MIPRSELPVLDEAVEKRQCGSEEARSGQYFGLPIGRKSPLYKKLFLLEKQKVGYKFFSMFGNHHQVSPPQ